MRFSTRYTVLVKRGNLLRRQLYYVLTNLINSIRGINDDLDDMSPSLCSESFV